jgi:hypothetical protein
VEVRIVGGDGGCEVCVGYKVTRNVGKPICKGIMCAVHVPKGNRYPEFVRNTFYTKNLPEKHFLMVGIYEYKILL